MLFNSLEFLLFLPIVFLLYWYVFKPLRWQNLFVVAASYVFYGWWDWRFLVLIAITTFCSYYSGLLLERSEGRRRRQQAISAANIILNLLILCYFKYCNFFGENFAALLRLFGMQADWVTLDILLPVGISFYTFQALSYTIDVYRHKIAPTHDPVAFFAFISFFPQLVAGPIERAANLLPQFLAPRSFDYGKAVDGVRQMLWGFFKKIVIADNCATVVDQVWNTYAHESGSTLLAAAVLFTFQIYCDFSGYSDIAIGTARLFGFNLMRNFNVPYFSRSIPEFWRRWHISLTTWLRDYIYFPLGGSRCRKWKVIRNIFIVWGISGFWHGANWTFICWGLFHAVLLTVYNLLGINTRPTDEMPRKRWLPTVKELSMMALTFALVVVGWIIFRSESVSQAGEYILGMASPSLLQASTVFTDKVNKYILLMLVAEWLMRDKHHPLQQLEENRLFSHRIVRWVLYILLISITFSYAGKETEFIYFQF